MECTGDKHVEFISFSCPGLFVMVCLCTFPYLRTRTDILMDTGNFISGLTECTGDKHYKCITRWKISFETLTHFSHSRAAPSQLKNIQIWKYCSCVRAGTVSGCRLRSSAHLPVWGSGLLRPAHSTEDTRLQFFFSTWTENVKSKILLSSYSFTAFYFFL